MDYRENEFLWVEKDRPRKLEDCILPADQKNIFQEMLANGEIQNILLCGGAGMGKTTVARALCEELETDYIIINGSEESGIDVLRTKIKQFASTVSFSGKPKVVILDEADYLNPNSTQPALRAFIEEFSANCRFILTCNFKNKIIDPLHSRCSVVEFTIPKEDKPKLAAKFFNRAIDILKKENVEHVPKAVAAVIEKHFPDFRRTLNELQRYSATGNIDTGILSNFEEDNFKALIDFMKKKDFTNVRKWVGENTDIDPVVLFRRLYDNASMLLADNANVAHLVMILANYQHKAAFVADQEINTTACMAEIMVNMEWK